MTVANDPREHTVDLVLAASGLAPDVWDEYTITLDMLQAGNAFTFGMWSSETNGTTWDALRRGVKVLDSVVVGIDGAAQLNGRIEKIETGADGHGEARMVISGRDLAGPALDWDADPTLTLTGITLEDALRRVFAGVGLPVRITTADAARETTTRRSHGARGTATEAAASSRPAAGLTPALRTALGEAAALPNAWDAEGIAARNTIALTPLTPRRTASRARAKAIKDIVIPEAHPKPGERVWAFAEAICARIGALMWTAPDAQTGMTIVVDTPNDTDPATFVFARRIVNGVADRRSNILAGVETIDARPAPTSVTVYTGSDRGDKVSVRQRAVATNAALTDARVTRGLVVADPPPQPRHMRSTRAKTLARAEQEGRRVILDAMRAFRTYRLTVRGHGQLVDGVRTLYAVNTMARVYDDLCTNADGQPLDEDMLITRVTFKRSRTAGTVTELSLVPSGALAMEPDDV